MHVSVSALLKEKTRVDYDDRGMYIFRFGKNGEGFIVCDQDEMEHLYNEMGSALMHRHYSQKPKEVDSEWEN
jgi:hypothetical protein